MVMGFLPLKILISNLMGHAEIVMLPVARVLCAVFPPWTRGDSPFEVPYRNHRFKVKMLLERNLVNPYFDYRPTA